MSDSKYRIRLILIVSIALLPLSGCVSFAANLLRAVYGNERPAEFDGLQEKKVAIVCSTDHGFASNATSAMLMRHIQANLNNNVKEIQLIRPDEVEQWLETHAAAGGDVLEAGKGVGADLVLAVDVVNMSLNDGPTLFRGKADISVSVYDVADGDKLLFERQFPDFAFPNSGGAPVTDTSEAKFRGMFLSVVAQKISGLFYPVDPTTDYALDATSNSF
ncbi:MAG: hypothetical protein KDB03_20475 [Planctomycetales bacterium]|nr:hypothetical protein [Planctomycetales bacterium]